MAQYKFVGEAEAVYPDVIDVAAGHTLIVTPNGTYELDTAPDAFFVAVVQAAAKAANAPDPTPIVAPADAPTN